jgi:uncharacterized protein YfiM (DUF2279 family)
MKSRFRVFAMSGLIFLGSPAWSQEFLGVPYDKWLHFETSALLSASVTQLERLWKWEDPWHLAPLATVMAANAAKETYDAAQPGGAWDVQDLATGTLGGLFGIGLSNAWTASPPVSRDRSPWLAGWLSLVIPGGGHFYNGTPVKGWAYLGWEAGSLFPLGLVTVQNKPATFYGSIGLFSLIKLVEVLDAVQSAAGGPTPASLSLRWEREAARLTWHAVF